MTTMRNPISMIDLLSAAELQLLRRHGLRLRVDRVSPNGRYALCTAKQVERRFMRSALKAEDIVDRCHEALNALHAIGLDPLIEILSISDGKDYPKLDPNDPFQLHFALNGSGLGAMLAPGFIIPPRSHTNGMGVGEL